MILLISSLGSLWLKHATLERIEKGSVKLNTDDTETEYCPSYSKQGLENCISHQQERKACA